MKRTFLFPFLLVALILNFEQIQVSAQSDSFFDDDEPKAVTTSIKETRDTEAGESPTKVDASGNLTVKTNEEYTKNISLTGKNLTLEDNSAVKGNITISGGNLIIGENVDITGTVNVNGNVTAKGNLDLVGGLTANTLSAGNNIDISGPVNVTTTAQNITIGSNSDLSNTLTSKAGLQIGSNSDVKLFLSGDSVTIDGKVYKLGGKIVSSGANTTVNLPFVPKQKNADGTPVQITTGSTATAAAVTATAEQTAQIAENTNQPTNTEEVDIESRNPLEDYTMPDISGIVSAEDVNSYVEKVVSGDTNISNLKLSTENIGLDYKVPASLFGFIPMTLPANVKVTKDKNVDVAFPWYSFFYSKPIDEIKIEENVSNNIKTLLDSDTDTETLTAKMQASITNTVLSSLKGLFGGK